MVEMADKTRVELFRITISNAEEQKILEYLRQRIRVRRAELKLSQRALSKKIGVSENFIARIESGKADPSLIEMLHIARHLDKPIKYFLPPQYRERAEGAPTGWEADVIENLRGMKEETRKAVIETAENLAK